MVGLEPTTGGLQIRFLSSTPYYHRPLRAQIERTQSALMYQRPPPSEGVAVK